MNLSEYLTKKKLLWLTGTLFIGALGSGLWEAVIKPSMLWFGTLMLDLATLGLVSLSDGMYMDMATGLYLGFLTALLPILRKQDSDGRFTSRSAPLMRKNWMLVAIYLACTMIFFVNLFRISYIVRASNHADQLLRIVAPYISLEERLRYQSQLAQVASRKDYVYLVNTLRSIAAAQHATVPEFIIY
jgi:hypothetical protein